MHTKLTLRIDEPLIKAAKEYSKERGKSLSQLISDYLLLITTTNVPKKPPATLPPITLALKGILRGKKISEQDYHKYLEKKYIDEDTN